MIRALSLASLASILSLALAPGLASADLLPPPPDDCPQRTIGRSSRGGGACVPTQCGDAEHSCPDAPFCATQQWPCPAPEPWRCEEQPSGLCVRTETRHGSRPGPRGGIPWSDTVTTADRPCSTDADCADGARCELARRCVHEPAASPTPAPPPTTVAPPLPPPATTAPPTTAPPTTAPPTTAPPAHDTPAPASSGGCRAQPAGADPAAALAMLLVLGALFTRSRRAR